MRVGSLGKEAGDHSTSPPIPLHSDDHHGEIKYLFADITWVGKSHLPHGVVRALYRQINERLNASLNSPPHSKPVVVSPSISHNLLNMDAVIMLALPLTPHLISLHLSLCAQAYAYACACFFFLSQRAHRPFNDSQLENENYRKLCSSGIYYDVR